MYTGQSKNHYQPLEHSKGKRSGQLKYYLKASFYEAKFYGLKRGLKRFWVSRWFWSHGHIGIVPVGYQESYWEK